MTEKKEDLDDEAGDANIPASVESPAVMHVVHIYEHGKLLRTIDRRFTEEMAKRFAEEYSRANHNCKRQATSTAADAKPPATLKSK